MSFWFPAAQELGKWIITWATGDITTWPQAAITVEAALPARDWTMATVRHLASRSRLYSSKPANTDPPGLFSSTSNASPSGLSARACRTTAGEKASTPNQS